MLRATLAVGTIGLLSLVAIALLAIWSAHSGPPLSGPEVQGGVILLVHPATAILFALLAFPAIASTLIRRGNFTRAEFTKQAFAWLAVASVVPAIFLGAVGFGSDAIILIPLSFVLLSVFVLPMRSIWLRWAR